MSAAQRRRASGREAVAAHLYDGVLGAVAVARDAVCQPRRRDRPAGQRELPAHDRLLVRSRAHVTCPACERLEHVAHVFGRRAEGEAEVRDAAAAAAAAVRRNSGGGGGRDPAPWRLGGRDNLAKHERGYFVKGVLLPQEVRGGCSGGSELLQRAARRDLPAVRAGVLLQGMGRAAVGREEAGDSGTRRLERT